ncbi:MAG: small multidrug resistance family (SMR) protein [uncultured Caballeronia sp.]|nr:MAG: small multidrug resistance family (SMR) protein [uncultured Caballeronia sp.]
MVIARAQEVFDEASIDRQLRQREALQVGQAGTAGAEVIDGERNAKRRQCFEQGRGFFRIVHQQAFRDFEHEPARIKTRQLQRIFHVLRKTLVAELLRRGVHRDVVQHETFAVPLRQLPLGTAYAVWTGIGAVGAFVFGIVMLGEAITVARIASAALIVVGLIGLKRSSGH